MYNFPLITGKSKSALLCILCSQTAFMWIGSIDQLIHTVMARTFQFALFGCMKSFHSGLSALFPSSYFFLSWVAPYLTL